MKWLYLKPTAVSFFKSHKQMYYIGLIKLTRDIFIKIVDSKRVPMIYFSKKYFQVGKKIQFKSKAIFNIAGAN